jgi:hypothetical protein
MCQTPKSKNFPIKSSDLKNAQTNNSSNPNIQNISDWLNGPMNPKAYNSVKLKSLNMPAITYDRTNIKIRKHSWRVLRPDKPTSHNLSHPAMQIHSWCPRSPDKPWNSETFPLKRSTWQTLKPKIRQTLKSKTIPYETWNPETHRGGEGGGGGAARV